jgi:gamma-glutamyltranspeptidase/glutathione hydrolase
VAHPFSSGLGGGLFAVTYHDGKTAALDARETAPASADPEFYQKNPDRISSGPKSVGVPGLVQGLWALHQRSGSLEWAELIEPAIGLAENGVEVSIWHHNIVARVHERLLADAETARIQLDDGKVPELGWKLVQADLAKTLRHIQRYGESALARGEIASKIAAATQGAVSELDLAGYQVRWREPIVGEYRGYQLVAMPPPSSGGVLLVNMLNMLESFDLAALGKGSSEYVHLVAEVMKLAFADRAIHLGDPDFYPVPVAQLTSEAYARERVKLLRFPPSFGQRPAWPDGPPYAITVGAGRPTPPDDAGTTHISVMDSQGNAVAITQTINTIFGAKITVPGTGIVLNNELDDFSIGMNAPNSWQAVGAAANAVAPGKRPLSSMTPMMLLKDGQVYMVGGSPMGTMIISAVLHAVLNVVDFGHDPQHAVMMPRFHHQWRPDRLFLEPEYSPDIRRTLEAWGHTIAGRSMLGAANIILFDPENCYFWGGVDGRRDSGGAALNLDTETSAAGRRAACKAGR